MALLFFETRVAAQTDTTKVSVAISDSVFSDTTNIGKILRYAETFHGTSYCFGSCGPKNFDCSGFVMHVFGKYGIQLPHGSGSIALVCDEVKLKKVRPGDLLFFSGRKVSKKNIGHVSIVKSVSDGKIEMIHATVQSGVISEMLDDSEYFVKRFIRAGRITSLK